MELSSLHVFVLACSFATLIIHRGFCVRAGIVPPAVALQLLALEEQYEGWDRTGEYSSAAQHASL